MKYLKISLIFFVSILMCISIYLTKNLKLDASSDTLILENDATFEYFKYYNNIFPSNNFIILAVKSQNKIDEKYINNINNIKKNIEKFSNVESIFSIVDAPILLINNLKLSDLNSKNIENINNSKIKLNLILNEFKNSPIFKDQLINENKNLSSLLIYTKKNNKFEKIKNKKELSVNKNDFKKNNNEYLKIKKEENLKKEELINEIRNYIYNLNEDYQYFLGGIDMITSDTIKFIKNDIYNFTIGILIIIIIILFFIFRNLKWVFITLTSTIISVLFVTGFISLIKLEITAISSNFILLMIILSISTNIHIINHYKINYVDSEKSINLKNTIQKMFWPCLYTTLTTIVAFGSLLFSNIKPLIDFGNIMIIALIFLFISSFTILPLLISLFPKIKNSEKINFSILHKFYLISINKTKYIFAINIIIFLISIYGIYKLNVENSFINYFKSNTEIYKGMKLIDSELGGTTPLDIIIKFSENKESNFITEIKINDDVDIDLDEDIDIDIDIDNDIFVSDKNINNWFTNEKINTIKKIHKYLESKNEVGKVQSLYSLIEMANLINKDKLTNFEISVLYNEIPDNYKQSLIKPYLSIDENMIKISARIKDSLDIKRKNLIGEIDSYISNEFKNIEEYKINGLLVLYNNLLQSLFKSQIKSFGIILISIFLMFLVLFRSFKISIIAIIPNIIASTFILGIIGIMGISLDIMTITIAAITIGIAVDNTIHYIYKILENKKIEKKSIKLIENTHNTVGNAILTTSLTISLGFLVLVLSNFIPTILFGLFTALAMITALVGVLITLPTMLNKFKI